MVICRPSLNLVSHRFSGDPDPQFRKICDLEADLPDLRQALQVEHDIDTGINYYCIKVQIAIFFGGTTLKGRVRWYADVSTTCWIRETFLTSSRANYAKDLSPLSLTSRNLLPVTESWAEKREEIDHLECNGDEMNRINRILD
jgi:hypothetical protein